MRPDMQQVIIERPRVGGHRCNSVRKRHWKYDEHNDDSGPRRMSRSEIVAKEFGGNNKEFSDLIGPLRGYLLKQVGRPWNKIWSEICRHADLRSVTGRHLRQHVEIEVTLDCRRREDGTLVDSRGFEVFAMYWRELYVDPDTGLLCVIHEKQRPKPLPVQSRIQLYELDGEYFGKAGNGCWFVYEMVPATAFGREYIYGWQYERTLVADYGRSPTGGLWRPASRRSANKKQLRKLRKKYPKVFE